MAIQKTDAFVIKTLPFRSSSLIVTFFSKEFGKIKGIAKGVRREREIRGAMYELFTQLEIVFYEKTRSELHLISDVAMIDSHDDLRTRLESITYASYFAELTEVLTELHDAHPEIFKLLEETFRFLTSVSQAKLGRIFEVRLLREVGLLPHLEGCLQCHKPLVEECFFSIGQGATFCKACASSIQDRKRVSGEGLRAIRAFAKRSFEESIKWSVPPPVLGELSELCQQLILYHLNQVPKSLRFMQQITAPKALNPS